MKKSSLLFLFPVLFMFLFGCQKEASNTDPVINPPHQTEDLLPSVLRIKTNDYSVVLDEVLNYSFSETTSYDLDLNNDQIFDLRFSITGISEPAGMYVRELRVETLTTETTIGVATEAERLCTFEAETNDGIQTTIENYDPNKNYNSTLIINEPIEIISPYVFEDGMEINELAGFEEGSFLLAYRDASIDFNAPPDAPTIYNVAYGNWLNPTPKFLAVKMQQEDKMFYSWIQLAVIDFKQIRLDTYKLEEVKFR